MSTQCLCGAIDCRHCGPPQGYMWCFEHNQSAEYCEEPSFDSFESLDDELPFDSDEDTGIYHGHRCVYCKACFDCVDSECQEPEDITCGSCVMDENVRYSNQSN